MLTRRAGLDASPAVVATTDHDFDMAGGLTGLTHRKPDGTTLAGYTYGYDATDRLTSASVPTPSGADAVAYQYDRTGQLTFADHTAAQSDEGYAYDANGNRTSGGSAPAKGTRLAEDTVYRYEYDAEGNRTKRTEKAADGYKSYTWDHHNRLTKVEKRASAGALAWSVSYAYDAFGNLVARDADGTGDGVAEKVERFAYDLGAKGGLDDAVLAFGWLQAGETVLGAIGWPDGVQGPWPRGRQALPFRMTPRRTRVTPSLFYTAGQPCVRSFSTVSRTWHSDVATLRASPAPTRAAMTQWVGTAR